MFIETIVSMLSGYVFWFILSRITTPEVIGISSTVVSISTIFITVSIIGIPTGIQRFLGKSFSEQKFEESKIFIKSSLFLIVIGIIGSSLLFVLGSDWFIKTFKIDFNLLLVGIILLGSSAIATLFRGVIIASLKTKKLVIIMILSAGSKITLGIILSIIGTGALGVTISFTLFPILSSILMTVVIMRIFKLHNAKSEISFTHAARSVSIASVANWIPSVIYTVGIHLGTVIVFGYQGASQAGIYFIAFSIVTAISAIMSVLSTIAYPVLSAMTDGRKRLAWRITKISLIITLPLSSSIMFYSKEIMQLFGQNYIEGSSMLEIMLLSILPTGIITCVNTLVYTYGNYKQVLTIGLASNVPRTVLYFLLIPEYGAVGAAISYSIGAVTGLIISIIIAKRVKMKIGWKDLAIVLLIPVTLAFVQSYFNRHYVLAILITLFISYILFLKLQIITRMDLQDSFGILPPHIANPLLKLLNALGKKLNSSY